MNIMESKEAYASALESVQRSMAARCVEDAEKKRVFHAVGQRCSFCGHALPGGDCDLRRKARNPL